MASRPLPEAPEPPPRTPVSTEYLVPVTQEEQTFHASKPHFSLSINVGRFKLTLDKIIRNAHHFPTPSSNRQYVWLQSSDDSHVTCVVLKRSNGSNRRNESNFKFKLPISEDKKGKLEKEIATKLEHDKPIVFLNSANQFVYPLDEHHLLSIPAETGYHHPTPEVMSSFQQFFKQNPNCFSDHSIYDSLNPTSQDMLRLLRKYPSVQLNLVQKEIGLRHGFEKCKTIRITNKNQLIHDLKRQQGITIAFHATGLAQATSMIIYGAKPGHRNLFSEGVY